MNKDLKVGQRVKLSPDSMWNNGGPDDPINVGGVIYRDPDAWVWVKWDNGHASVYNLDDSDLIPVDVSTAELATDIDKLKEFHSKMTELEAELEDLLESIGPDSTRNWLARVLDSLNDTLTYYSPHD